MEHPGDREEDDSSEVEVEFIGVHKKKSKVWEEYKPIFINGKAKFAECVYCHRRFAISTGHLGRHLKTCPVKPLAPERRHATVDDIRSVTPSRFKLKEWKEFIPIYVEGKIQAAECIHCHRRLSANYLGGHLRRHLLTCPGRCGSSQYHPKSRVQDELSPCLTNGKVQIAEYSSKLPRASSSGDNTPLPIPVVPTHKPVPASDSTRLKEQRTSFMTISTGITAGEVAKEPCYEELAKMIIFHGYSLSIMEHEEMIRVIKNQNPMVNIVSRNDMEEHCFALFQKRKVNVKEKIALTSRRVSLSASIWSPDEPEPTVNYLCLTAHFISEDWKVHRLVIKFGMFRSSPTILERIIHCKEACVPESESGSYNVIWDAIRDWNLDQKILSLTSVAEVRTDANTWKLKEMLIQKKSLPIRGKVYNIACVDDLLNSLVSEGQSAILCLVGDVVMDFCGAHESSLLSQKKLLEVISETSVKCPREDAKWWYKLYFRLEVILQFKKSFPSDEVLSPEDMRNAESICNILRTMYCVIQVISGPSSPTANIYFNEVWKVRAILQEEASSENNELARLVLKMQDVLDEYWQNAYLWLLIPVVLDPRFKTIFIEFHLKRAFGTKSATYLTEIHDTVQELFIEYCNPMTQPSGVLHSASALDADYNGALEDWDQYLELAEYLEDGLVPRKDDFDILNWWMKHTTKYPTLAAMARDILAMPASAVQSEAAFTSSGPVIPKHHSTLSMKTIEALVCTRD